MFICSQCQKLESERTPIHYKEELLFCKPKCLDSFLEKEKAKAKAVQLKKEMPFVTRLAPQTP